jgi:hypothetical protein
MVKGFSISIPIPISISMRYFLRWVDEIRTHRDRDRYRDRSNPDCNSARGSFGALEFLHPICLIYRYVIHESPVSPCGKMSGRWSPYKEQMDRIMAEHAVPFANPFAPARLGGGPRRALRQDQGVPRQRPGSAGDLSYASGSAGSMTGSGIRPPRLDAVLARDSGLLMFIVSMVQAGTTGHPGILRGHNGKGNPHCCRVIE